MLRVAVVTDSQVLRAGLASVLDADGDMQVAELQDADVAIAVVRGAGSRGDTGAFRGDAEPDGYHERPTLVLLERMNADVARETYAAGASAVLTIDASDEELTATLRAIAAGLIVLPSSVSADLMMASPPGDATIGSVSPVPLTKREAEVLALLAKGFANKVVAARLGITEATVKTHIAAVYEKLNARNRAEAVVAAARQGLITL